MSEKRVVEDDASSVASSSSSSSSSLSSDDGDVLSDGDEPNIAHEMKLLEDGIKYRQKILRRILRGKEGTTFAKMLSDSEDRVNAHLLENLRRHIQSPSKESKSSVITSRSGASSQDLLRAIKNSMMREFRFTLPGCISLITHCSLYLSIYGCLSKLVEHVCACIIIHLTGWHIKENSFDCTWHERFFHATCVVIGCCMARMTGSIYAWNENELFQQQLKAEMKTRSKSSWDVQIVHWFSGKGKRNSQWRPRLKSVLDTLGFFLIYISVDALLLNDFARLVLDSRAVILDGMPSRQLKREGSSIPSFVDEHGAIDQCTNLEADNDSSTAVCLNSFSIPEDFTTDVINWLENKNRCGWTEKEAQGGEEYSTDKVRAWRQHDEEWKQSINEQDEIYLMSNVSYKAWYELVGDPSTYLIDSNRENIFLVVLTLGGFAVLLCLGSPFNLI
jgi:hypothetical protein